jgi:hypothetical protein
MSSGRVRLILLCEDAAHESFALSSFPTRFQRFIRIEKTGGNAKVIARYPRELRELRSKRHQQNLGLLVIIDGDDRTYEARKQELEERLAIADLPERAPQDPVAIVVPSRNIETWIAGFLKGFEAVDELHDYKGDATCREKDAARRAGEFFGEWLRDESRPAPENLPALADARTEFRRLPRPS